MQTDPRKGEERFTAGPGTYILPLTPINQLTEGDRIENAQSLCFHPFPVVTSLRMASLFLDNTDTSSTSAKSQRFSGKPALFEQEKQFSKAPGQRSGLFRAAYPTETRPLGEKQGTGYKS